jgi:superfamily II DNA or RNA helicase|tara:strand:- start:47 stop:1129 length:1083 start_codon:yes stop_codon:yes gene_type:complete
MTIRDKRQKEFADIWLSHGKFGILNLCPRFGKIRTTINILDQMNDNCTMLIAYPDNKIKQSWIDEFELMGYINENITYTTHRSIEKNLGEYDIIIIDEIHLLSEAQTNTCKELIEQNDYVLGLTGTLSKWSKKELLYALDLSVIAEYPIHKAIEEGVIADYQITVVQVPLDNTVIQEYTKKNIKKTELQQYKYISGTIRKMMYSGGNSMFARLARMRIIQNSLSKQKMTKSILNKYKDERILVFCGITKIADALGIPSHHSKSKDKEAFVKFAEGEGNHMAVVKIGNTGVTYKPLNKVIINYFDSNAENLAQKINRCMAMEYDTPDKKSEIYIISSNESVELKWLEKALEFFDKSKVKYV